MKVYPLKDDLIVKFSIKNEILGKHNDANTHASNSERTDTNSEKSNSILEDTGNIIDHTSNLLTYITIFFALLGVTAGFGIYKYIQTTNELKRTIDDIENKTLDAGLTTLSAVPLVEATQITSDSYYLAIETIKDSIQENRGKIKENFKYSKLFIVEALYYWNMGLYEKTVEVLKEAMELALKRGDSNTIQTVAFHLARAYKQWGYENENRREEYFNKAIEYADRTFDIQKKVIKLSVAAIRYYYSDNSKEGKENFEKALYDCISNMRGSNNHLYWRLRYLLKRNEGLSDFAQWTAFTVMALYKINPDNYLLRKGRIQRYIAKKSLFMIEESLPRFEGGNIVASWYRTASQLAEVVDKKKKGDNYKKLSEFYKSQAKGKLKHEEDFRMFNPYLLVEEKNTQL